MTVTHRARVWLGWRKPATQGGPRDWPAFRDTLGKVFLPETWRVMTHYGLQTYGPSILSAQDDAQAQTWPDETALLVYSSEADYDRHRNHADGLAYSRSHSKIFNFAAGLRASRSGWANERPEKPADPCWRKPSASGVHFAQPNARLTVLYLSIPAQTSSSALITKCPDPDSEAVAWCTQGIAVVWLCSRQSLAQGAVLGPIQAAWPSARLHQWHQAEPLTQLTSSGVAVRDNAAWQFAVGLTQTTP